MTSSDVAVSSASSSTVVTATEEGFDVSTTVSSTAAASVVSSSSSSSKRPFAHVLTSQATQELKLYQDVVFEQQYNPTLPPLVPSPTPTFEWKDVTIESVLGQGSFSFVFEVVATATNENDNNDDDDVNKEDSTTNTTTAETTTLSMRRRNTAARTPKMALKCLKASAMDTTQDLIYNAMDLYSEANILERLSPHPHIIQLLGTCRHPLAESFWKDDAGYFVVLEIMTDTLQQRLNRWRNSIQSDESDNDIVYQKLVSNKSQVLSRIQQIAMPIVIAMEYIHSKQIVVRDLKPENIGFDQHGNVKLFDFGLARSIHWLHYHQQKQKQAPSSKQQEESSLSTEASSLDALVAGSILYMAPEVLQVSSICAAAAASSSSSATTPNHHPIGYPSDVYSFSIMLWELCTLEIPLRKFQTMQDVQYQVGQKKYRPSLSGIPSSKLKSVLQQTWKQHPKDRPTFPMLRTMLETILSNHCNTTTNGTTSSSNSNNSPKRKLSKIKFFSR